MNNKINIIKIGKSLRGKGLGTLMMASVIVCLVLASVAGAESPPIPVGISGYVLMSDGITQAPTGTNFKVHDTTSGSIIEDKTGGPPGYSGRYSVSISGNNGDQVLITAWNSTHYGERTITVSGDMTEINVSLNTLIPQSISSIVISGSPTTTLTVGDTHQFTATVGDQNNDLMDGIELTWTVSNTSVGNVGPTKTITVSGNATSTFTAQAAGPTMLIATNGSFSGTVLVIVNAAKQAPVANPNGPYTGTEGIAVSFNGSASSDSDGNVDSYSWNFGDGGTATGATPSHTYVQNGTYTVTLTVTDNEGTPSLPAATTATISDINPVSDFSGTPFIGTEPLTVAFTDESTSYDGLVSRTWDFGDGTTASGVNPSHDYTCEGTYTVTLTVCENDGDCDTKTKPDYITVSNVERKGDIDGDGEITTTDALLYLKYSVGQNIPYPMSDSDDVTGDGIVDIADALAVLKKAVDESYNFGFS